MMLAGFEVPTAGWILIKGETRYASSHRRKLGAGFSRTTLCSRMTVEQNLGYPLRFRAMRGSRNESGSRNSREIAAAHAVSPLFST